MPNIELDSTNQSEQEFQSGNDITCNCELCHARLYVSTKQSIDDDCVCFLDNVDGFHLLPTSKSMSNYFQNFNMPIMYPWLYHMPFYADFIPFYGGNNPATSNNPTSNTTINNTSSNSSSNTNGSSNNTAANLNYSPNKCLNQNAQKLNNENILNYANSLYDHNFSTLTFDNEFISCISSPIPQVYISKDSVLHIRLSTYVSFERSISAYRLINYRNNSALALNESGEYGYAYHYNCRGLINMHHGKLSITFDKDRQVLLRNEKPSFVKKETEFYRLTSHHWTACRPVSMDMFDRDRTPEILKKPGIEKSIDDAKLRELISSSAVHKDNCGMIIYLGDAKIEQKVNGDVVLSWFYEDRANSLIVSPLSGSFSLSTKNLEIMATPKADIYIAFIDFFVHVGNQQMTVSSGAVAGRCNLTKSHPCLLRLTSTLFDNQSMDLRQYCAYSQSMNQQNTTQATNTTTVPTITTSSVSTSHHHSNHHSHHGHNKRQTPMTSSGNLNTGHGNSMNSTTTIHTTNSLLERSNSGKISPDKKDDTSQSISSCEREFNGSVSSKQTD